jgi:ABC-2 type transporter
MEELDDAGFFPKDDRDIGEAFMTDSSRDALGITNTKHPNGNTGSRDLDAPPPGMGTQIGLLFTREMNNLKRDTTAVGARFGLSIFLGVLIGVIFFDVGDSDPASPNNLNSHFGALIMVLLMSMFGTAQPALLAFPQERPVFLREYSTNHYSVISYFMARFTVEAFITGLQCVVIVSFWSNVSSVASVISLCDTNLLAMLFMFRLKML